MVTRRKAKAGGIGNSGSPTAKQARVFASTSEVERKRKAEQSLADQVTALRQLVTQLVEGQKKQAAQFEEQEAKRAEEARKQADLLGNLARELQAQQRTIVALEAAIAQNAKRPTYSEVAKNGQDGAPAANQAATASHRLQKNRPMDHARVDERAVSIDTGRSKGDKADLAAVKQKLQGGLDKAKVTEGLRIEFLRPGPGERIDVIFRDKVQAEKARKHTQWATGQFPGTRVKGEQWYPIKCDMVAKQAVMDVEANDGKTLRQTICQGFSKENVAEGIDFTAMKVHWLSKVDVSKKVGSLVIWLKDKLAADHLLRTGTAIFGATGAYCSKWERREDNLPCFNCNKYGHKQAACKAAPRCALCSGQHSRHNCPQPTKLKCPACSKVGHSIFDWQCQLHPSHWKYKGMQKVKKSEHKGEQSGSSPATVVAGSGTMPISDSSQGQPRQSTGAEKTKEREVDMIDAVETGPSDD
jgi:hypothetical protein